MCTDERRSHVCKNNVIPLDPCVNMNKTDERVKENESPNWKFKNKCKDEKQLDYDEAALF